MTKTILSCDFMNVGSSRLFLHYSPIPSIVWSNTNHGVLGGSNKSIMLDMLMPRGITYYSSELYAGWRKKWPHSHCVFISGHKTLYRGLIRFAFIKERSKRALTEHTYVTWNALFVWRLCGMFWQHHLDNYIDRCCISTVKYCDFLFYCTWCFQPCLYSNVRKVVKTDHLFRLSSVFVFISI